MVSPASCCPRTSACSGSRPAASARSATLTLIGSAVATMAIAFIGDRWSRRARPARCVGGDGRHRSRLRRRRHVLGARDRGTARHPESVGRRRQRVPPVEQSVLAAAPCLTGAARRCSPGTARRLAARGGRLVGRRPPERLRGGRVDQSELAALRWVVRRLRRGRRRDAGRLSACRPPSSHRRRTSAPGLGSSRPIVLRLSALFSLDSFAGGFVVQSLLALWLFLRFDLSVAATGVLFFWPGLLPRRRARCRRARRRGRADPHDGVHPPPGERLPRRGGVRCRTSPLAIVAARRSAALLSQMDVPARTSYVMAVVPPDERAAAASVTNVPRSLASAATPLSAGAMLVAVRPSVGR